MDHIIIMNSQTNIDCYIEQANKFNIPFTIVDNNMGDFNTDCVNWDNIVTKVHDKNACMLLSIITYDNDMYLVCCLNVNGHLQVDNTVIFTNFEQATVMSIRYFNKNKNIINKNVTFTAMLKSNNNLKKCKGNFFYSV